MMSVYLEQSPPHPSELVQLLDEHHLVVLSESDVLRRQLAAILTRHLASIAEAEVIQLDGSRAGDLDGLCRQLETQLQPKRRVARNVRGVTDLLRSTQTDAKLQYFVWQDADVLLDTDVRLFSQLTNALLAVAAEREHISPETLVIQRVVFLGGDKLGAYAESPSGQFCSWLIERGASPFWEVISCVERPPVLTYRLDG